MPIKTKATFYRQLAINQFIAARTLAVSSNPKIQSIIWIQMIFFALELAVKSYLIHKGRFVSEKQLKVVSHKFWEHLKGIEDAKFVIENAPIDMWNEMENLNNLYIDGKLRYLSLNLIFHRINVSDTDKFLVLAESLIAASIGFVKDAELSGLLNH